MPPRQDSILQDDYSLGSVLDVAPHLIPANGAAKIIDATLEEDGTPSRRGGTAYKSNADFGSAGLRFVWDGYLHPGLRTVFASPNNFGVLDSDDSTPVSLGSDGLSLPVTAVELAGLLFIGGGYVYGGSRKAANYSVGTASISNGSKALTGSGTSWTANVDPGMLIQFGNERVYVVESVNSNTSITLRDAYEGSTKSGATYVARRFYKITAADPYRAAPFYAVVANRLVYAEANEVISSEPEEPHLWEATIGGVLIPNGHELPKGAFVTGLANAGDTLLCFTTQGVWTIHGLHFDIVGPDGTEQHRIQEFSGVRLTNPTGITRREQTLIVPATDGIYLMDGTSQPHKISDSIEPLYHRYVELGFRPGGATVHRNHYFLPIIDAAAHVHDLLVCRLDRPVERRGQNVLPWTFFAGHGGNITAFANHVHADVPRAQLIAAGRSGDSRVLDCSAYFAPDVAHAADADGSVHRLDITTRDFATGGGTLNVVRNARTRYVLRGDGDSTPELQISYALGDIDPALPYWGHEDGEWGTGFGPELNGSLQPWTSPLSAGAVAFVGLGAGLADLAGTRPHRVRINRRARHIRYRIRTEGAAAQAKLRSLETFIRPAGSRRR